MEKTKIIGQTKDVGFEIGVRRTFPISSEKAWEFLFSDEGLRLWLGELTTGELTMKQEYKTKEDVEGIVKVFKPFSYIRLTWKKEEWQNRSTLQIRVIAAKSGTTISFHQEKLLDSTQREEMQTHWESILGKMSKGL